MCGRFTLTSSGRKIQDTFDLDDEPELAPRYNIAPTQESVVVRAPEEGRRRAERAVWGFSADAPNGRRLLINARAETVADKPSFRESFARRRCLVPADGFYEWRVAGRRRLPFHFAGADGGVLALGGLWKPTLDLDGAPGLVFTILTVEANEVVAAVHPRMPLILPAAAHRLWLDADSGREALAALLVPLAPDQLVSRAVSTAVNDVRCDSPECLAPAEPEAEQLSLLT